MLVSSGVAKMEIVWKFEAWMNKITKHKIIDKARYNARKGEGNTVSLDESINPEDPEGLTRQDRIPVPQLTPEQIVIEEEKKALVREWINVLPENYRVVIILYYLDGLTTIVIANFLRISQANVSQILKRARDILKEKIPERLKEVLGLDNVHYKREYSRVGGPISTPKTKRRSSKC
jgi:RNA polymerase sigma-70 factor (ECF subfamily)